MAVDVDELSIGEEAEQQRLVGARVRVRARGRGRGRGRVRVKVRAKARARARARVRGGAAAPHALCARAT